MADATTYQEGCIVDYTAVVAVAAGELVQFYDGRAGYAVDAIPAGVKGGLQVRGIVTLAKTTSQVWLSGGRIYWDASASKGHFRKVNDRDYYAGRAYADAAATDTVGYVELNVDPQYDVDLRRDGFLTVPTGTQAVGGFGFPKIFGGAQSLELTATSEPQCIDLLSVDRFSVASNPILEAIIRVPVNGTGAAVDFNLGFANGTSTSDADAVTEHCFIHVDGASLAINAQSKDGTTTVAATDTTTTFTAGSAVANRKEIWMDARDPTDVQIYVDGVLVLASTVFALGAAAGPLGLLVHLEKSTGTTTGQFIVDAMRCRLMEQ